jgi:protein-disulfide isomerase
MADGIAKSAGWRQGMLYGGVVVLTLALAGCASGLPDVLAGAASTAEDAPSAAELRAAGSSKDTGLGDPNAPVTLIEYASLGCPICAAFHKSVFPKFKAAYIDTGKVYYIYREFPIGKSSAAAAQAARCVPEKHYFRINNKFMANRGRWNGREPNPDLLYKIVQDTGLSRAAFDSCMANQKTSEEITRVKQRGREFGIKGTPTFFINGQHIRGAVSFEEMRKLVDKHLSVAANPA